MAEKAKMPPNFSWVVENVLAASAYPRELEHYIYMKEQGISKVVSLTEQPAPARKGDLEFQSIHIGMPDFTPPTISQVETFIDVVNQAQRDEKALVVHCQMGRGRTGTMCACFFVHMQGQTADQAIGNIRRMRPGSIETSEQERLVHQYVAYLKEKGHQCLG